MAIKEILLVKPVEKLGGEGDQVSVRAGYARNFLFPNKMALPVNNANKKQIEALIKRRAIREANELASAEALKSALEALQIKIIVKAGDNGKLFGSVTAADLVAKIAEAGIELPKKVLHLEAPVKDLGDYTAFVKLHKDVKFDFKFSVESDEVKAEVVAE
ncbi:MAG: 50S ribosomal protein L9 [Opitutales bacterium]